MDGRTQKQLAKIGTHLPKKLLAKLVVEDKNDEEREMVEEIASNPRTSPEHRKRLKALLASGQLSRANSRAIDPKVSAQLNHLVEKEMAHAINSGRIKLADKNDPFLRAQRKRMRGK